MITKLYYMGFLRLGGQEIKILSEEQVSVLSCALKWRVANGY